MIGSAESLFDHQAPQAPGTTLRQLCDIQLAACYLLPTQSGSKLNRGQHLRFGKAEDACAWPNVCGCPSKLSRSGTGIRTSAEVQEVCSPALSSLLDRNDLIGGHELDLSVADTRVVSSQHIPHFDRRVRLPSKIAPSCPGSMWHRWWRQLSPPLEMAWTYSDAWAGDEENEVKLGLDCLLRPRKKCGCKIH